MATKQPQNGWRDIESLPDCHTALTIHECDIFPVSAFRVRGHDGSVYWYAEVEGPEDDIDRPGAYRELTRPPTHWKPIDYPNAHGDDCAFCAARKPSDVSR